MTFLTSIAFFMMAVICYSIKELKTFGKLKWMDETEPYGFWGEHSDKRKYKMLVGQYTKEPAFFLSTSLLVFLTDGFHLMQFVFKIFLIGSLVTYQQMFNPFWDAVIYFGIWQLCFAIVYRDQSK